MITQETHFQPDQSLQAKNAEKLAAKQWLGKKWILNKPVQKLAVPLKY